MPMVVYSTLGDGASRYVDGETARLPAQLEDPNAAARRDPAHADGQAEPVSLQDIRESLQIRGVPPSAAETMLLSKRESSHRQYSVYLSKWAGYCITRHLDRFRASQASGLEFLQSLLDSGASYSALNTARSALSAILVMSPPFGQRAEVIMYMKGAYNLRPPRPKYRDTWDPQTILRFFKSKGWCPARRITLKRLTLKLVMLILLTSGQRSQVIRLINLDDMVTRQDAYVFSLTNLKQSRIGYENPDLRVETYPADRQLCAFSYMREYLHRTSTTRGDERKVFLTYQKPHHAPARDTVAKWITRVMNYAGLDVRHYAPHSTRSASTSAASRGGASTDAIMKTAGWSNSSTFAKYYKRNLNTGLSFADSVLNKTGGGKPT